MRNVLITGATGGIGSSILKLFYNNNYNLCVTGTNIEKLNEIEVKYKGKVKCISCNLNDKLQIEKLVQQSNEYYGSTDILINNAGITKDNLFLRMKDEEWDDVINVNLNSNFKLTKQILKGMIKSRWGRVVNISSDAAKIGNAGQANYVASKSAIEGLTRTLANEVASRGITVNCVSPGFVETEILETINEKTLQNMVEKIPLGRMGRIDEIASAVYFLSSEESAYITGQVLHVNGGLTM
ncbi:beta-ketoacyl-ACP reductase [Pelagibacterales bacterium SAG-MED32]|nr:beta-ketoacyl-ACP reductase [Pelagibacterales bacterium SAG-MED32]